MAVLYAIEVPYDDCGNALGDTLFASGFDAYDTLDPKLRNELEGKHCFMQYNRRQEAKRLERIHDHPRPPMTEEQKAKRLIYGSQSFGHIRIRDEKQFTLIRQIHSVLKARAKRNQLPFYNASTTICIVLKIFTVINGSRVIC